VVSETPGSNPPIEEDIKSDIPSPVIEEEPVKTSNLWWYLIILLIICVILGFIVWYRAKNK
jgi:hypothetical protein